jgi:hypothetical protein
MLIFITIIRFVGELVSGLINAYRKSPLPKTNPLHLLRSTLQKAHLR